GLPAVVRHNDVGVAVVVDIAEGCTPADLGELKYLSRTPAGLFEAALPQVAEQQLWLVQRQRILGLSQRLDRLHGAVDDERIQPAIVVEIEPRRPEPGIGQAGGGEPGRLAPLFEDT